MCFIQEKKDFTQNVFLLTIIARLIQVELQLLTLFKKVSSLCFEFWKILNNTFFMEQLQASGSGIKVPKISSLKSKDYILSINAISLLKIYYNITTKWKLLKSIIKTLGFLLQQAKEIGDENGNQPNKKGEFERLFSFTSRA